MALVKNQPLTGVGNFMRASKGGSPLICSMQFNGHLLMRGFWLYVWRITSEGRCFAYVGRTGDSSSSFASSPFARVAQHLNLKEDAKSNSLVRHLWKNKLDPTKCAFELIAFGPLFPEQESMNMHSEFRDRTAALEAYLANELKTRGLEIMGTHFTRHEPRREDLALVREFLNEKFPKG